MATFDSAKNKKTTNKRPWYIVDTKKYSVYVWGLPLLPIVWVIDAYKQWADKRRVWDTDRATRVLDHVLPKVLEWVEEDKAFYYCMEWGTSSLWRQAKRIDREWARKWEYQLRDFIKEGYENKDYTKTVEKDYYDTWVKFAERA